MPELAAWRSLLVRISTYYRSTDEDRYTLERSLEISSREMMALHDAVDAERAQLQTILASLPQGLIVIEDDQRVILTNPAARRLMDSEPSPGDALTAHLHLVDDQGRPLAVTEREHGLVYVAGRGGVLVPVQIDRVVLGDRRTLLTLTDLSERMRHQHALERARVEAEVARRAEKARASFLARMSHELRTPLNAILGYTEILDEEVSNPQSRSDLARIHASGSHLLGLINDVLDLSKVDAGHMEARPQPTDLDHLITDVIEDIRPLARRRHNEVHVSGATIGWLHIDPVRTRQCLYNLLANAAHYTDGGRIDVVVSLADDTFSVAVRDTGTGIDPAVLPTLFEPFQQATQSRGGTGLGLALVRSLSKLLGGRCEARSTLGVGSTFTLILPLDRCTPPHPSPELVG